MTAARRTLILLACMTLLAGCASVPVKEGPSGEAAVAVWDLENLSIDPGAYPDMSQVLSDSITEAVRQAGEYRVLERRQLLAILEELKLGSSSLADEETGLRIGRLAGAGLMVFGGYQVMGKTMRIDLRLVEVSTGRIVKTSEITSDAGDIAGWLTAASQAAAGLL